MEGDAARPTGRRGSRKPRVNYLELLGGVVPENADPNTPAERSHRKPRAQRQQHAAQRDGEHEPEEQPQQPRGSKRKTAQRQQQRQQQAVQSAEAAETVDGTQEQQEEEEQEQVEDADYSPAAEPAAAQPRKQKRQRVLVDVHRTSAAAGQPDPEDADNEYERARLERIRRNQEMLKQMGIQQMAQDLATTAQQQQEGAGVGGLRQSRPKERRERAPALPLQPSRKSARMRGLDPSAAAEEGSSQQLDLSAATEKEAEQGQLLELEEYFQLVGQDISSALVVDGRYHGWVNPAVCERYGLAGNADEAWEGNGGGKFKFKIDKKDIPAHLRAKGWSDARAFASTQLKKNPNSYFYRHVAPHEQQAQGEWTEEEHELFMSTARANGVGDKWGLFASFIPQRVGYQCSAYYRDVVIPQGLVIDKRFKITRSGKAVFVG